MIGITGGIGSGKSVVSRVLRLKGYSVYDCDLEAKRIMDTSADVLTALNARFGDEVCPPEGPISRPALASRVFSDESHRLWLNTLVHRLVRVDLLQWKEKMEKSGNNPCFVESAIMASSGLASLCDEVWIVTAPDNVRLRRAMARDHSSEEKIRTRIEAQMSEEKTLSSLGVKILRIDNSEFRPLLPQISSILPIS